MLLLTCLLLTCLPVCALHCCTAFSATAASGVCAGLKAALILAELGPKLGGQPLPAERLFDAVNVILSYQNHDGGWATYENTRSFHALEVRSLIPTNVVMCGCCCSQALGKLPVG